MKNYTKSLFSTILLSTSLVSFQGYAVGSTRDAVTDSNGNVVRSILSNECVRTKWDVGVDDCAPKNYFELTYSHIEIL